mgnify:CR=1 FL=1|tara:strand:+ start:190 stop:390 length:201 start_codon:yes stop_codon:yes gene_type:complete
MVLDLSGTPLYELTSTHPEETMWCWDIILEKSSKHEVRCHHYYQCPFEALLDLLEYMKDKELQMYG